MESPFCALFAHDTYPAGAQGYAQNVALSDGHLRDVLSRMSFIDSTELVIIRVEPHAAVHGTLSTLLGKGILGRLSSDKATLNRARDTIRRPTAFAKPPCAWPCDILGLREARPHVQGVIDAAHPQDGRGGQRQPTRRLDVPRHLGIRSWVGFHRRGRFDATVTLHDGRIFNIVRQGLVLRRRSLYDRLRAIAEYDYSRRPGTVLVLIPSGWE